MEALHARILTFVERFHARSVWRDTPFDGPAALEFFLRLREHPDGHVTVSDHGMVAGFLTRPFWCPSHVGAQELLWYSEVPGEGARLREIFERWANAAGAAYIGWSAMADEHEPALRRLMGRAGYQPVEIGFRKVM